MTCFTSTSHIKIQKFVQIHNSAGQRSKHFVFHTHNQVSFSSLKWPSSTYSLSRQIHKHYAIG
ncbi:hypothetical protein D9738_15435 [Escherichia sp. E10V5]|nr:hypothetical protein D9734_10325 [Escherichia sp. E14S1]RZN40015.1 hypothetical protein D9738_15435 [Escherichia sp. E10V5]